MKSYGDDVIFYYDKEIPQGVADYTYLAVISVRSALKKDENYYPQVFLKECKYIEKQLVKHISESKEIHSRDSDEESFFL